MDDLHTVLHSIQATRAKLYADVYTIYAAKFMHWEAKERAEKALADFDEAIKRG